MSPSVALGLAVGLTLLVGGGDTLVRSALAAAVRLGVPSAVIGSTVVAVGTSLPELFVSVRAALAGSSGIAVGNIVGSNLYNLMLILGVAACIHPLAATGSTRRLDAPWLPVSALALVAALWGGVHRWEAALLLLAFVTYLALSFRSGGPSAPVDGEEPRSAWWLAPALVAVLVGSELFVASARDLAVGAGLSERVIGLTVVSIGTSAPEIVTSWMAAWRRDVGIALGNVLGSNIFNALGILGITALIQPTEAATTALDRGTLVAMSVAVAGLIVVHGRVPRIAGFALVAAAVLYTTTLLLGPG